MVFKHSMRIYLLLCISLFAFNSSAQETAHKIVYQEFGWHPDGKSIFFSSIKVKPDWSDFSLDKWGLYMFELDTRKLHKLDSGTLFFSISRNGIIAYDKTVEKNRGIYYYDLNSNKSGTILQSESKESGPTWSPDGKLLAFYGDRDGAEEIYVLEVESKEVKKIVAGDGHKCFNPKWSPDGEKIVYYFEKGDAKDQIYITNPSGDFHTNLTDDSHHNIFPSWTSDGRIVYTRNKGEVMIMNDDGSQKEQLVPTSGGIVQIDPSGEYLITSNESFDIILVQLETGTVTTLLKASEIYP